MTEPLINLEAIRTGPKLFQEALQLIKSKLRILMPGLAIGVDYDRLPHYQEADDYGLVVATRQIGDLIQAQDNDTPLAGNALVVLGPGQFTDDRDINEVWEIDRISIEIAGAVNRAITIHRTGIYLLPEDGVTILAARETPAYPIIWSSAPAAFSLLGCGPLVIDSSNNLTLIAKALGANKFTVDYSYRIIRK